MLAPKVSRSLFQTATMQARRDVCRSMRPHMAGFAPFFPVHYCNRKNTARLQPLQRVFHRMLTVITVLPEDFSLIFVH